MLEFRETATCNLTPIEFDAILDFDDLEASDPPCYTRARKKAALVHFSNGNYNISLLYSPFFVF